MPDTPKALAWIQETICVGFKGDSVYMLYHVSVVFKILFCLLHSSFYENPFCPPAAIFIPPFTMRKGYEPLNLEQRLSQIWSE